MSTKSSSDKLQKKIILFSAAGLFIISTIVAAVSIIPLYDRLISEQEKTLVFAATTKTMAIEEFLTRSKDIANQITSRTRLRQKLEAYNAKEISLEELLPFFRKALGDALSGSEEVLGITRLDDRGQRIVQLGIVIPESSWPIPESDSKEILVEGPVKLGDQSYLVIRAPILANNSKRVGTDIVVFDLSKLRRIVTDFSGMGDTGETVIGILEGDQVVPLTPARQSNSRKLSPLARESDLANSLLLAIKNKTGLIKPSGDTGDNHVIAYGPLKNSNWGIAVKMDEDELYKSIENQLFTTGLWIVSLILAGTLGMLFLLRPLAGKILMQTSDLELEIKEKTSALINKEAHIRSIVDTAADGIISIDENGLIELFNPAAQRIFGYEETDVIGSNIKMLMPEPFYSQHDGYLENYRRTGTGTIIGSAGREVEGVRKDNSLFPMELTVSELHVEGRHKFTGMVRDITERKQAQEELHRRYEDLKSANENLKSAQSQLLQSEKMASIGQLAAGVAHEINNPVGYVNSNISSLAQYLQDLFKVIDAYETLEIITQGHDEELANVKAIKEEVGLGYLKTDIMDIIGESKEGLLRVKQIVQDLKDFSHVDEAEWQWADLHKGLDSTLNVAQSEIKYKAEVVKEYGDIPHIECMASQINQVFMNLLVNAAHAIKGERGVITIRTGVEAKQAWVAISDTGEGIPEDIQNRIFEPFFTTKEIGKGTGLGLSLSYGIIEKHGGRIDVSSEMGKGTTFTIWLPIEQTQTKSK